MLTALQGVGRYGGEEFLVVLNKCDPGSAVARAENLRYKISSKPVPCGAESLQITISIGLALSSDFLDSDIDEIIQRADVGLYAAKSAGRNCVRLAAPGKQPDACRGDFTDAPSADLPQNVSR